MPACLPDSILAELPSGPRVMSANGTRTCLCTRFGVWNANPTWHVHFPLAILIHLQDEDLFVHTFGIRMLDLPGLKPVNTALQALAVAEEQLEQRVLGSSGSSGGSKEGKASSSGKSPGSSKGGSKGSSGGGQAVGEAGPTAEQAAALLARIRFRRLLLEALQSLQQYKQAGVEAARKQCQLAEAQLQLVAESAGQAAPAEEAPGFVPEVNRKHMGLVPPRPAQVRDWAVQRGDDSQGSKAGGSFRPVPACTSFRAAVVLHACTVLLSLPTT